MCDTLVAFGSATVDGAVWFGKNSDREPGEPQVVEIVPERECTADRLQCTYLEIPQVERTNALIMSRPTWMWGCEMGVNEHGVAIGNEAVFTKLPVRTTGLTGMDLVRLGLERAGSATQALDVITELLALHPQGGSGGYRNESFRYHNSFLIADAETAWILETADDIWAAKQVRRMAAISNVLTIGHGADRLSEGAVEFARARGWSTAALHFSEAFGDRVMRVLSGGDVRRQCTAGVLWEEAVDGAAIRRALRSHGATSPTGGWRSDGPCAHASWLPTRHAAQTNGSLIARLTPNRAEVWATGTSAPCLSIYKRVPFDPECDLGRAPGEKPDESLWWRHERYHRTVMRDHERLARLAHDDRVAFEEEVWSADPDPWHWERHRDLVEDWYLQALREAPRIPKTPSQLYWRWRELRDAGKL